MTFLLVSVPFNLFAPPLDPNSQKFGWELKQADEFENGEFHLLPIEVDSGAYIVARLFESEEDIRHRAKAMQALLAVSNRGMTWSQVIR